MVGYQWKTWLSRNLIATKNKIRCKLKETDLNWGVQGLERAKGDGCEVAVPPFLWGILANLARWKESPRKIYRSIEKTSKSNWAIIKKLDEEVRADHTGHKGDAGRGAHCTQDKVDAIRAAKVAY